MELNSDITLAALALIKQAGEKDGKAAILKDISDKVVAMEEKQKGYAQELKLASRLLKDRQKIEAGLQNLKNARDQLAKDQRINQEAVAYSEERYQNAIESAVAREREANKAMTALEPEQRKLERRAKQLEKREKAVAEKLRTIAAALAQLEPLLKGADR